MPTRSKTWVATDYKASAERERAIATRLEAEGKRQEAEYHYAAARHFEDKADFAVRTPESRPLAMSEATVSSDGKVIAWRPKDTLRDRTQLTLDASAERKELLLGPHVDVCALGLEAAESIEAANSLEKMLAHELALAHKLAVDFANRAAAARDPMIAAKLMNVSLRLMETYQHGLLTIHKMRSGNTQTVNVQHVHVHGGQTVVAGSMQTGGQQKTGRGPDKKQ